MTASSFLLTLLLAVQMISAVAMIGLILVQHGKGADKIGRAHV